MTVLRRDQVLMTFLSPLAFIASTFFSRWSSTNGPFLRLLGMSLLSPRAAATASADDHRVGGLLAPPRASLGLAPRRHRVAAAGRLALATAQGVVDGVHRDAARLGAHALPA